MVDCQFCSLSEGSERCLSEDAYARVLLAEPRLVKGHLLVVPRRHVELPWQLMLTELMSMFSYITVLQERLTKAFGGCTVRQHCMPFLPQGPVKADHIHFHVLPRSFGDELYQVAGRHEDTLLAPLTAGEAGEVKALVDLS